MVARRAAHRGGASRARHPAAARGDACPRLADRRRGHLSGRAAPDVAGTRLARPAGPSAVARAAARGSATTSLGIARRADRRSRLGRRRDRPHRPAPAVPNLEPLGDLDAPDRGGRRLAQVRAALLRARGADPRAAGRSARSDAAGGLGPSTAPRRDARGERLRGLARGALRAHRRAHRDPANDPRPRRRAAGTRRAGSALAGARSGRPRGRRASTARRSRAARPPRGARGARRGHRGVRTSRRPRTRGRARGERPSRPGTGRGIWFDWSDARIGHPLLDVAVLERPGTEHAEALRGHWLDAWATAIPGSDPHRAWPLVRPLAALGDAIVYQGFLDAIEASERIYHEEDVIPALELAAAWAATSPPAT